MQQALKGIYLYRKRWIKYLPSNETMLFSNFPHLVISNCILDAIFQFYCFNLKTEATNFELSRLVNHMENICIYIRSSLPAVYGSGLLLTE